MIKTLNFNDFLDEWNKWEDRKNTFSYEGKKALFEYLEQYEEETDTKIELDIIALCCDYTEYSNIEEVQSQYSDIKDIEGLRDKTDVIEIPHTQRFIIQNF